MAIAGVRRSLGIPLVLFALVWPGVCGAQPGIPSSGESDPNDHSPKLTLDAGGHTSGIYKLLLNGYGDQLISIGLDKAIRFWDVKTGEMLRVLHVPCGTGSNGWLFAGAISPDGSLLAVGGDRAMTPPDDFRILLISLPEGNLVRTLKGHTRTIRDLAFSPDGQQLASASSDSTARIWNPQTGETVHELKGHTDIVRGVAWSPDGKRLATVSLDKTGRIWSAESGESLAALNGHGDYVNAVAWRPDGVSVATGCDDQFIRLFAPDGRLQYSSPRLPNCITSLAFSRDSRQLLYTYSSRDDVVAWGAGILDMTTGRQRVGFNRHPNTVVSSLLFPDGKTAVTGDAIGNVFMWDTTSGAAIHRLSSLGQSAYGAGWSPDGSTIAWGNTNRAPDGWPFPIERTFNLRTLDFGPAPNNSYYRGWDTIGPLTMQISNGRVATFSYNGQVTSAYTLPLAFDSIESSTLVGNNRAALGTGSGVFIIDCRTGQLVANLQDHGENVFALAVSGDQRFLLSAGGDQMMHISNLQTNQMVLSMFVAGDEWVAWTPEGFYAASAAGESLMGWLVNHGLDALPSYYPASRFHNSLYRPDIIRRVIDAGGGEPAARLADAARAVAWRPLVVNDVLPPRVSVSSPSNHATVSQGTVDVQATASASGSEPVQSLRVFVDGRPGELKTVSQDAKSTVRESWKVSLTPGEHQIVVKADTSASDSLSDPITVTSSVSRTGKPALYALCIDVGPTATAHGSDAQAIADSLRDDSKAIYEPVDAQALAGKDAGRAQIAAGFARLREKCGPDDVAVIFYRGASARNAAGTPFLAAADTRANALDETALNESMLRQAAQTIRGKVLIWLDAAAPLAGSPNPAASLDHLVRELLRDDCGAAVISLAGDPAQAPSARGLLARLLIDGLHGAADTNQDRVVHLNELEPFVVARVKAESQGRQRAIAGHAAMIRSMPLATAGGN